MPPARKSNRFVLVWNNYSEYNVLGLKGCSASFIHFSCENMGTPHLQGYLEYDHDVSFHEIHKDLGFKNMHLEEAYGTQESNSIYIDKPHPDGSPLQGLEKCIFKKGTPMPESQYKKKTSNISELRDQIVSGSLSWEECACEYPNLMERYRTVIPVYFQKYYKTLKRPQTTRFIWVYGSSGSGKSHFAETTSKSFYVNPYDGKWFDAYEGQEVFINNEFRASEMAYHKICKMADKWTENVSRRNKPPFPFVSKYFIISCVCHPKEIYTFQDKADGLEQLMRRVEIIDLDAQAKIENFNLDMYLEMYPEKPKQEVGASITLPPPP